MDIASIVLIAGFALSLLLGFLLGFGRTLKFLTGGIVGIIISIFLCATFGGMIARIGFISDLIARGNEYFGGFASILARINVATIIYYIILFIIAQIIRVIIVHIIKKIFQPKDKKSPGYGIRNAINRVLGLLLFGAFFVLIAYLAMAVIALLEDVESVNTWLSTMRDNNSFFYKMYTHNPIDFSVLFAKVTEAAEEAKDIAEQAVEGI